MENKILLDRENRNILIKELVKQYDIVVLKANIVGKNKNINLSFVIIGYFERLFEQMDIYKYCQYKEKRNSFDGKYIIYGFKKNSIKDLKNKCMSLEEESSIGRLIDIDVYKDTNVCKSENRQKLRKCLVCNQDAFICIRNKTHTFSQIYQSMLDIAYPYLHEIVKESLIKAMKDELDLTPKFGCVTKDSNGSHKDMNYKLMEKAQGIVCDYLLEMFKVGYYATDIDTIYPSINEIGRHCEKEMYNQCNGVNCYKGLIFCLGILISSIGYTFTSLNGGTFFANSHQISKDIFANVSTLNTFGAKAYIRYGFGGIRKEVINGLPTVQKAFKVLTSNSDNNIFKAFIEIIRNCDDTVLLKRAQSVDKYNYYKKILGLADTYTKEELNKVNEQCISDNISLGGCADLLVCTLFIKNINDKISLEGELNARN